MTLLLLLAFLSFSCAFFLQPHAKIKMKSLSAKIKSEEFVSKSNWTVERDEEVGRIDVFLMNADTAQFPSANAAKKSVRRGLVTINGNVARIDSLVTKGDIIEHYCRVSRGSYMPASFGIGPPSDTIRDSLNAAKVLLEDDHLALMKKPAGCTFDEMNTISLMALKPPPGKIPELLRRPAVVHRLDRQVAGVLLVAKTLPSLRGLSKLFLERKVKKTYQAIVAGRVGSSGSSQVIDIPLEGKPSVTRIVVERVDACKSSHDGYVTTLRVFPETGRNHQIRKHLSYIGHPIICDDRYWFKSTKPDTQEREKEQCWRAVHKDLTADYDGRCIGLMSTGLMFVPTDAGLPGSLGQQIEVEIEPTEVSELRDKLLSVAGGTSSTGSKNDMYGM